MKIILGSGLIGLLARFILGPEWKVIPFYRSRFFTYNPALDDNFVIANDEIAPIVKDITGELVPVRYPYKVAWSIQGEIVNAYDEGLCLDWGRKLFGPKIPPQFSRYMQSRMDFRVFGIRANQLYARLLKTYKDDLVEQSKAGDVTKVGDHFIEIGGKRIEFDQCVSTIPLNKLCPLMNAEVEFSAKDVHYLHVQTEDLNFEGNNQLLVVDEIFDFYKSTNIAKNRYLLYCHNEIPNPGMYLMSFIKKFEILDGSSIAEAIPAGAPPDLKAIENYGIFCVGSYAQWDWCMDISSCMLRLMRYGNRGAKPSALKPLSH